MTSASTRTPTTSAEVRSDCALQSAPAKDGRRSQRSSFLNSLADHHSWPVHCYRTADESSCSRKQEFASGILCLVRFSSDCTLDEGSLVVEETNQGFTGFVYGRYDEVVSKFLRLSVKDTKFKGSLIFAMPHCMTRNSAIYRETILKAEVNGTWSYFTSEEAHFDDYKEGKFAQARFEIAVPTYVCVVSRYRREEIRVPLRSTVRIIPSTDQRVCIKIENGTFPEKSELRVHIQIQPVDTQTIKEVHATLQPQGYGLITSSHILSVTWKDEKFRKPVTVCLPIPPNQARAKRHVNKSGMKSSNARDGKPVSRMPAISSHKPNNRWYMGIFGDEDVDAFYFMHFDDGSEMWSHNPEVKVQEVQKDLLQFQLPCSYTRFAVVRTRAFITPADAKVIFNAIEQQLKRRTVRFVLFQGVVDHGHASLFCVLSSRFEELYDELSNEGWRYFGEKGPPTSKDVSIEEGQLLEISLRGNIRFDERKYATRHSDVTTRFYFNSQLLTQLEFFVYVNDPHLQKSYEFYKGLCVVAKCKPFSARTSASAATSPTRSLHGSIIISENYSLCELTLQLTKQSSKKSHLPLRPHTVLKHMNPKNKEAIEFLSPKLGKEWESLGVHLGMPKGRVQAIKMRNKLHPENCKDDMLVTWAKTQTNAGSRLTRLYRALMTCGRIDLAYKLEDIYNESNSRRNSTSPKTATESSTQGENTSAKPQ